jgi:vacuolar-type H+-ATPase subunit E/Vma4
MGKKVHMNAVPVPPVKVVIEDEDGNILYECTVDEWMKEVTEEMEKGRRPTF